MSRWLGLALALTACSTGPFYIGEQDEGVPPPTMCPAGETCEGRLEIPFDRSGTAVWSDEGARWILRGEDATATSWPFATGGALVPGSVPSVALDAPFTDSTRAVSTSVAFAGDASLGTIGSGDVTIEAVFRAAPGTLYAKGGLSLAIADSVLRLSAGATVIASEPLFEGAWYHCALALRRGVDTAVVCNGQTRREAAIDANDHDAGAPVAIGGGGDARLAWLAAFDTASSTDAIRSRFFALTGALPTIAGGTPLPPIGVRNSPAFLDLIRGGARRLHLVGPEWPRVSCRTDPTTCGYLAEAARFRRVPWRAREWIPSAATITPDAAPFATDLFGMDGLVADATLGAHALSHDEGTGDVRQVFSLFARPGSMSRLRVAFEGRASVLFDLAAPAIVEPDPIAYASIEPWGDGIVRLTLIVDGPGERRLVVTPENAMASPYAGDGSAQVYLAGFQLEVNAGFASALLGSDEQESDELTFEGAGNVPTRGGASIDLELVMPDEPRIHDGALVNLNSGSFDEQVNLFVASGGGVLFWGIAGGASRWSFGTGSGVLGMRTTVSARWDGGVAALAVGGETSDHSLAIPLGETPFDRIDVGFSSVSSGPLEGLLRNLRVRP